MTFSTSCYSFHNKLHLAVVRIAGDLLVYIYRFKKIKSTGLRKPIRSISIAYTFMTKKHSHILVGLEGSPGIMIVMVRNSEPQLNSIVPKLF